MPDELIVQIIPLQKNNTTTTMGNCVYIYIYNSISKHITKYKLLERKDRTRQV
jgi:hypothetical protein